MARTRWIGYAAIAVFVTLLPATVQARPITLAWDPSPELGVTGYVLFYGTQQGIYTTSVDVGNVTTYMIDLPGSQYYFTVRAHTADATSGPSNEVAESSLIALTNPGNQSTKTGFSVNLPLAATGSPVSWAATNLPGGLNISASTGLISGTVGSGAAASSPYVVGAIVSNGSGNASSVQFNWSITVNQAPAITTPPNQTTTGGSPVTLAITATDPDGDALTFGASGLPPGLAINAGSGMITGIVASNGAGTYSAMVSASDSALTRTASFTWTVTAPGPGGGGGGAANDARRASDFDKDTKADFTVFRASTGGWYTLNSGTNYASSASHAWGLSTDVPVPGDYDGDGKTDPAVYRASTGGWYILKSSTNFTTSLGVLWGLSTDKPMPGDYDGDGKTDIAVYRPTTGGWYYLKSSTNNSTSVGVLWGLSTDTPVPGDYDGDGKTDPAVFRQSTGGWYILKSSTSYSTSIGLLWGLSTDVAVPGDYDGDGRIDPAVYRAATGGWYYLKSSSNYSTSFGVLWGLSTDVAVPADYDGDGKTDPAVFRPSTGWWYVLRSGTSYATSIAVSWGMTTDLPLNKRP